MRCCAFSILLLRMLLNMTSGGPWAQIQRLNARQGRGARRRRAATVTDCVDNESSWSLWWAIVDRSNGGCQHTPPRWRSLRTQNFRRRKLEKRRKNAHGRRTVAQTVIRRTRRYKNCIWQWRIAATKAENLGAPQNTSGCHTRRTVTVHYAYFSFWCLDVAYFMCLIGTSNFKAVIVDVCTAWC